MQCIPGGNLCFWQEERKVSTVGKGVERGRCSRGWGWGELRRTREGDKAHNSTLLPKPHLTGLGGGLLQEAFSDGSRAGEE